MEKTTNKENTMNKENDIYVQELNTKATAGIFTSEEAKELNSASAHQMKSTGMWTKAIKTPIIRSNLENKGVIVHALLTHLEDLTRENAIFAPLFSRTVSVLTALGFDVSTFSWKVHHDDKTLRTMLGVSAKFDIMHKSQFEIEYDAMVELDKANAKDKASKRKDKKLSESLTNDTTAERLAKEYGKAFDNTAKKLAKLPEGNEKTLLQEKQELTGILYAIINECKQGGVNPIEFFAYVKNKRKDIEDLRKANIK